MRVLHVAAELYPWIKSGGLGDVLAALPAAQRSLGVDARILIPGFRGFLDAFAGITDVTRLQTPFAAERVRIGVAKLPGDYRAIYLVDQPSLYDRPGGPYAAPDGGDWPDNHRRFGLLCWVAAALGQGADPDWRPDVLHAHDWHAGLAPAYLRADSAAAHRTASLFTIHNIAYQGWFPATLLPDLALPSSFFSIDGLEFYGGLSFLKAGLVFSDHLTTVSPTYAREIQTPAFGFGLDGVLRSRAGALTGILNGVDPQIWDPGRDPALPQAYGADNADTGKRAAKTLLRQRLGLEDRDGAIMFGAVSRFTPQKGLDLVLAALPRLLAAGTELVVLGSGDTDLEDGFMAAAQAHPGRVGIHLGYDEPLAHLIIAAADVVLAPSRFEPCGLTQLYGLRYGALPLVRQVGGLADTVVDATALSLANGTATGFAFAEPTPQALLDAAARASGLFGQREIWRRMMRQAMTRDFSWATAARSYHALYRALVAKPGGQPDLQPPRMVPSATPASAAGIFGPSSTRTRETST